MEHLSFRAYDAVALFLVVPLVFVVAAGEIDLSFPSIMGFSAWMFALVVQAGLSPYLGIAAAVLTGALLGYSVGALVCGPGMRWRGLILKAAGSFVHSLQMA